MTESALTDGKPQASVPEVGVQSAPGHSWLYTGIEVFSGHLLDAINLTKIQTHSSLSLEDNMCV